MRMTISDNGERLGINLVFPDSRVVDLDSALHQAGRRNWLIQSQGKGIDYLDYLIRDRQEGFLAAVRFTHGLEPPTRALFENRLPQTGEYGRAHRQTVLGVVRAFLEECSERGLLSRSQKDTAMAELERHDKVEV